MANLPDPQIYYRPTGAADDAWILAATNEVRLVANQETEICCVKASAIKRVFWSQPDIMLKRVITRYATTFDLWSKVEIGGGTVTISGDKKTATMVVGTNQRAFLSFTPLCVIGRTYVFTCDIDAKPSTGHLAMMNNGAICIPANPLLTSTQAANGTRCGFLYTATETSTNNFLRLGLGIPGNASNLTMTVSNPMYADITDCGFLFDGYGANSELSETTPGHRFTSGTAGVTEPVATTQIASVFSKYSDMLAIGDSFANDNPIDWPFKMAATVGCRVAVSAVSGGSLANNIVPMALPLIENGGYTAIAIQGGVNDINFGVAASATRAALESVVSSARAKGMKILCANVAPWKGSASWTTTKGDATLAHNDWLASGALGSDVTIIDIYTALEDPANTGSLLPAYNSGDNLHPNQAGMQVIADAFKAAMIPAPVKWVSQ